MPQVLAERDSWATATETTPQNPLQWRAASYLSQYLLAVSTHALWTAPARRSAGEDCSLGSPAPLRACAHAVWY